MTRLLTPNIASMTEMRKPHKVLERSGGEPVAILRNSALVGYFVPAEAVDNVEHRQATRDEVMESLARRKAVNKPVLEYLKDR
jgi:antitoxin StbD